MDVRSPCRSLVLHVQETKDSRVSLFMLVLALFAALLELAPVHD